MFSADFFAGNRRALREKFDQGGLFVFTGNGLLQRSGSTTYPFRQDSSFWYLTGIDEPDVLLVMHGNNEYLILPKRDEVFETFNGKLNGDSLAKTSGIKKILDYDSGLKSIKKSLQKKPDLITFLPLDTYIEAAGFYPNPARQRLVNSLKEVEPSIKLSDARQQLVSLRTIKQPAEIAAIKDAISITISVFEKVKTSLKNYATEKDVLNVISHEFLVQGANGHAYDAIVAAGKNACVLHHLPQEQALKSDKLVLIDAGAEVGHYASDLTRTYALSKPSARQIEVYQAVMSIREFALKLLKPGINLKEYESSVKTYVPEILKSLGLDAGNLKLYYPHSTSHFLGLDVHDPGDYEAPLGQGAVLTVEPGIYIEEEKLGIRIEDNIMITGDGYKNLSASLSRELI